MMNTIDNKAWETLPETSRVWIYQANRQLNSSEIAELEAAGSQFITGWNAHGQAMSSSFAVIHERFAVLMADEEKMKASGCSIDSSVHFIQSMGKTLNVDFFDRMVITYLNGDVVEQCHMTDIPKLIDSGQLTAETSVFDNLVADKASFNAQWKAPLKETWMKRYLKL